MNVEALAKEHVEAWFNEWLILEAKIHAAHTARSGEAAVFMQEALIVFQRLLIEVGEELLPINGAERLAFIQAKPSQYACYRQLDELFKETKKRSARLRLQADR
ncbi:YpoC family protein [Lysinibacillus piscis]|uniref:YpoC-like domain-containing protein n=1 Tax=Lysinibacillus piscis TaxID=2518931 RepID=A0ABQ5NF19_9BACI|nr:hypothetical protein [Lysinibacillus sp. KH24]GLC86998.1 hypothetical protein LYSBPC_01250 [Lysinibacillus sp. KH24]